MPTLALFTFLLLHGSAAGADPDTDDGGDDDGGPAIDVTVTTAERGARPRKHVPAETVVLPRDEIARSPTLTTDDLLRTVPSAATFRRSSSLVADPSSQGLNLRGLGPSAVSRALVLVDGVPMNDPFGGWIYWRALPRLGVGRVELVPSGGSSLYGSAALGGVVQLISRPSDEPSFDADVFAGTQQTLGAALRGAGPLGPASSAFVELDGLKSDGFPVVAAADRGAADHRDAPSVHGNALAGASLQLGDGVEASARAGAFREMENGGSTFTSAGVSLVHADASLRATGSLGSIDVSAFGVAEEFEQTRARFDDGRAHESLAAEQRVPADEEGASIVYATPPLGGDISSGDVGLGAHTLSLGFDARRVQGESREAVHPAVLDDGSVVAKKAGGEQVLAGAFMQDAVAFGRLLDVDASLRADLWRNASGHRSVTTNAGDERAETFADRTDVDVSPRLGALLRPFADFDALGLRASIFHAFRAPTLNELYRPFQVGTVLTDANENLRAEKLWGTELGAELSLPAATMHATGFWNDLEDPVVNETLPSPLPDGALRIRKNLGAAHVRGVDTGVDWRALQPLTFSLAYTFVDAVVASAPGQANLVGKRLPQDPQSRVTAIGAFDEPRLFTLVIELRAVGDQFEDDLNTIRLPGYAVIDASLSRKLAYGFEVYAAADNILDTDYLVGDAGVRTVGAPFALRGGLRFRSE